MSRGRAAFSLVELLTVVAVVALLVGLVLPALGRAREASRQVKCLSNQRQIGVALTLYMGDFEELTPRESGISETRLPPPAPPPVSNPPWPYVLRPYLDERATSGGEDLDPGGGLGDRFEGAPYYKDPSRRGDLHQVHYVNNGLSFAAPGQVNEGAKKPTPFHRYARPFDTIYLACFTDDAEGIHAELWYRPSWTTFDVAQVYDLHHPSNVTGAEPLSPTRTQRIAPRRHVTGANGLFLDSHAALTPAAGLTAIDRWDDLDYAR